MSKVLLINGSPHERGCTYTALAELADTLNKNGVETEFLWLGKGAVADCSACNGCYKTGRCVIDDDVNALIDALDSLDGIVAGSPVYYGSASGRLCSFLDRLFYAAGDRCAGKLAAAVVSCRRGGATAAFQRLNMYFAMNNMVSVGSQYWNQIHGNSREEALQDGEGLQTMRTLGTNMAWLLKNIDAGRAVGITAPEYEEKHIITNFIRG